MLLSVAQEVKRTSDGSTPPRKVATVGVSDLIVVHTSDATLVCPKAKAQEVKALLKRLEARPEWKKLL